MYSEEGHFLYFKSPLLYPKAILYLIYRIIIVLLFCGCVKTDSVTDTKIEFDIQEDVKEKVNSKPLELNAKEYVKWYRENQNSLQVKESRNDFDFVSEYHPGEIEALKAAGENVSYVDSILDFKNSYIFITFSIIPRLYNQEFKTKAITNYAIFDIKKDFSLAVGKDTLDCNSFIPLREELGIRNILSYYLVFQKKSESNYIANSVMLYNDHLFNQGEIQQVFSNSLFFNLPTLLKSKNTK